MTMLPTGARPAVFLDRDGVLNEAIVRDGRPFSPVSVEEFVMIAGVSEACERVRRRGFALVVVTNQPDLARGKQTTDGIAAIHKIMADQVCLDAIYVCPHVDSDNCSCRKPKPGMLFTAAQELRLDLLSSFMIGDRWSDIEAGQRAGCRTIFVANGYKERYPEAPDQVSDSPIEALAWIFTNAQPREDGTLRLGVASD